MKRITLSLILITLLGLTSFANAVVIVDTGPGPNVAGLGGLTLANSSNTANSIDQWLAAEFTLANAYYLTDLRGWLGSSGRAGQTFTISIYGDGGEIPDVGNLLYSNSATIVGATGQVASWEGYAITFGNGLQLAAGNYWIGFESRANNGDTYDGYMPTPSVSPLTNHAYITGWTPGWQESDSLQLGVRISGNLVNSVPVPAPLALLGLGLLSIGLHRRRK